MIDRFPDTILFTKALNHWMHRTPEIHRIDPETNIAVDCAMLNAAWHRSFNFDLQQSPGKTCCAPEFDCRDCRVGPVATFTLLAKLTREQRASAAIKAELDDLRRFMMRYHFWDWEADVAEQDMDVADGTTHEARERIMA